MIWGAFPGHCEVTLSISTSNFMCDACVMHTCTGLVEPKTGKVKKLLVFKAFLKGQSGHGDARESLRRSEPNNFLVTLEPLSGHFGHLRVPLGHLMITLGSLWSYFGCNRVDFEKHSFSQSISMIL